MTRSACSTAAPLADQRIGVPVLICYGLVGRWTMTDLQEDRSLVRNLLNLGIDLYVMQWIADRPDHPGERRQSSG